MRTCTRILFFIAFSVVLSGPVLFMSVKSATADPLPKRLMVFISDLHWGFGQDRSGKWDPREDFRWPNAFKGLLDEISKRGKNAVDLVIVGDLLDLWQPPDSVKCEGHGENLGCTVDEMKVIASAVLAAHKTELEALRRFLNEDTTNHVYIIPGNHDAALLIPDIGNMLFKELDAASGRITFVASGIWISPDRRIVAEHGHQIGSDVNRFKRWPKITEQVEGKEYIIRPWGELFVQKLFNKEEEVYKIIDNLSPETAGAWYRLVDRGLWKSIADVARLIAFGLFETSFQQQLTALGGPDATAGSREVKWSREKVLELGYQLFTKSMPSDDPFRKRIEEDTAEAWAVREELNRIAGTLPDEDLKKLCSNMIVISEGKEDPCGAKLGNLIQKVIPDSEILGAHLLQRKRELPALKDMSIFLYGHTHEMKFPWVCNLYDADNSQITVVNSGAFQRLLDKRGYLKRAARFASPEEGLSKICLEELPPCYTVVTIDYDMRGRPKAVVETWHMEENGKGGFITPGMEICQ